MKRLRIGQVAERAGVGVETVRFYEREGFLPEPPRTAAGYRQYGPDAAPRIRFLQRAQRLGFSLREAAELLDLRAPPGGCAEVRARAQAKLEEIREKIRDLERIRSALAELVEECSGRGSARECPILDALEDGGRGE